MNKHSAMSGLKGKTEQCNVPSCVLGGQRQHPVILPKIVWPVQSGPKSALVLAPLVV